MNYIELLWHSITSRGRRANRLYLEIAQLKKEIDALVAHCDKEAGECSICGKIVCPYADPMHFHHD